MRLIHKTRHQRRGKGPRIEISQDEITADLHYPGNREARPPRAAAGSRSGGGR